MPAPPPQRVLVTGATGFVGRMLALRLARSGRQVVAWVRSRSRARESLGDEPELIEVSEPDRVLEEELARCSAVVNLAGAGLFDRRWTAARKRELVTSRVETTRHLVEALGRSAARPRVLVSASAVGFYGTSEEAELSESSPVGPGFLADLCREWEASALAARRFGVRVVPLRIGIVLGPGGGALGRMLPPFRAGIGGRLGSGRQWMSWIHVEDLVELVLRAIDDPSFEGPTNATAPGAVQNREFTRTLAQALGRPAFLPAPAPALRAVLGESSSVLLEGQRVAPVRALAAGFEFRHPELGAALRDLVHGRSCMTIGPAHDVPGSAYLARRRPSHLLEQTTPIPAPLDEVFAFFSRSGNLGAITPPATAFEHLTPLPVEMAAGCEIDYRIRLGPVPIRWRSRIEVWDPPRRFADSQVRGPYACWWHEHAFRPEGKGTVMEDRVWYAPPLGPLGRLAQGLLVAPRLREVFEYRALAVAMRFGERPGRIPRGTSPDRALLAPAG